MLFRSVFFLDSRPSVLHFFDVLDGLNFFRFVNVLFVIKLALIAIEVLDQEVYTVFYDALELDWASQARA